MEEAVNAGEAVDGPPVVDGGAVLRKRESGIVDRRVLIVLTLEMSGFGPDVADPKTGIPQQFPLDCEIPLLRIGRDVRSIENDRLERAVERAVRAKFRQWKSVAGLAAAIRSVESSVE